MAEFETSVSVFTIQDLKAGQFNAPFTAVNEAAALRQVQQWLRNKETTLAQFPDDFRLFYLGKFFVVSGRFEPDNEGFPVFVCDCSSLKEG